MTEHAIIILALTFVTVIVTGNITVLLTLLRKMKIIEVDKRVRKSFSRHLFFVKSYDYVNRVVPKIKLKNKNKERVVKKFLTLFIDNITDALVKVRPDNCTHEDMMSIVNGALRKTYSDSTTAGVPKLFLDKFEEWFQPNYEHIVEWSDRICSSQYFESEDEKFAAFLDLMVAVLSKTIADAEATMNTFNGELDKVLDELYS